MERISHELRRGTSLSRGHLFRGTLFSEGGDPQVATVAGSRLDPSGYQGLASDCDLRGPGFGPVIGLKRRYPNSNIRFRLATLLP